MNSSVTKYCSRCKTMKTVGDFFRDKHQKDGLNNWCKDCMKVYRQQYMSDPDSRKRELASDSGRKLKKNYGISLDEYDRLLEKQGGVCVVCGKPPNGRRLHVDHDHKTGEIRGLLCNGCNVALGAVDDSTSVLQKLINYLLRKD